MNKKLIYGASSLMLLSGLGFTSCQSDNILSGDDNAKGSYILTVKASKGDDKTRTEFEEKDGNLISTWNAGDKLYVVDGNGVIGTVTLVSGAGTPDGVFEGDNLPITAETNALSLWYINDDIKNGTKSYTYRNASQNGTFESMAEMDVMSAIVPDNNYGTLTVNAENKTAEMTANLKRRVAEAHFTLSFSDGNVLKTGDVITISAADTDKSLFTQSKFTLAGLSSTTTPNNESITVTKTEDGNDLYLTMLPCTVSLKFTVTTASGKTYNGELEEHPWKEGEYVRKNNYDGTYSGIEVKMVAEDIIDHSKNPLLKWAEGNAYRTSAAGKSEVAPMNGNADENSVGSLYQWGRNYGFSSYVEAQENYFCNSPKGTVVFRCDGTSSQVSRYTSFDPLNSYQNMHYFLCGVQNGYNGYINDWISGIDGMPSNYYKDSWEDRTKVWAGDNTDNYYPLPSNYKLPSKKDAELLVPQNFDKDKLLAGTLIELKSVDNIKLAMKWEVITVSSRKALKISGLVVPNTLEEISEVNWNDSNVVSRTFMGNAFIESVYGSYDYYTNYGNYAGTRYYVRPFGYAKNIYDANSGLATSTTYPNMKQSGYSNDGRFGCFWTSDSNPETGEAYCFTYKIGGVLGDEYWISIDTLGKLYGCSVRGILK